MTRFFVSPEQIVGGMASLDADDAHHLRVVLQARLGDRIAVLDGAGQEWPATLETLTKSRAVARLGEPFTPQTEPKTRITVAQALPKMAEKMEQVLQRCTEIGASEFWAFQSERSLTHLTGERHEKRLARWRAIVKTAAEQAHRACLPNIRVEGGLGDVLAAAGAFDVALFAHPADAAQPLRHVMQSGHRNVLIMIGPESGFSDAEATKAVAAGAVTVSLGPRILRTETAAMVMAAQIIYAEDLDDVR